MHFIYPQLVRYMALFLTLAICTQRISIAVGNILIGISLLIFIILLWKTYRENNSRYLWQDVPKRAKTYIKVVSIIFLCILPSVIFSYNFKESLLLILEMWVYRFLPLLMIVLFVRKKEMLLKMLGTFFVAEIFDAMVAMYQGFVLGVYRPWGFGSNTLNLPGILVFLIPIMIIISSEREFSFPFRRLAVVTVIFSIIAIILGKSRGAWLLLSIITPLLTWKYLKANRVYLIGMILLAVGGGLLFSTHHEYQQRLYSTINLTTDRSNADRVLVWESAIHMIQDHPLVGVGPSQFKKVYNEKGYVSPENTQDLAHTHNNIIQVTTESGLIGGGALTLGFLYLIYREIRLVKKGNVTARMRLAVLLGVMFFGMIDYTLDESTLAKTMWFLLGIFLSLDKKIE